MGYLKFFVYEQSSNGGEVARNPTEKGYTFVALSKRSLTQLVVMCEKYQDSKLLYSSWTFEACIEALGVAMRAKYDCPAVSKGSNSADVLALWKQSSNAFFELLKKGLIAFDMFVKELPEGIVNGIFSRIVEVLEGYLLSPSEPAMITPAGFTADEDFDIAVLSQIQNERIPCFGKPYVPDHLILRLAEENPARQTLQPQYTRDHQNSNLSVHKAQGNLDNDIGWLKIESPSLAPLGSSSSAVGRGVLVLIRHGNLLQ
ncbi:hypothetical protein HK098_004762, partial [Nowakowskiella sp. JEL0407]